MRRRSSHDLVGDLGVEFVGRRGHELRYQEVGGGARGADEDEPAEAIEAPAGLVGARGPESAGDSAGRVGASSTGNFRHPAPAARGSARASGLAESSSSDDFAATILWPYEVHGDHTRDVHKQLKSKYPEHLRRSAFPRWLGGSKTCGIGFPALPEALAFEEAFPRAPAATSWLAARLKRGVAGAAR